MGIPLTELYEMTEYEFSLYKLGYQKREMAAWERTRFGAWMVQATQSTKPLTIEEVMPLPVDEERKQARAKLKTTAKVSKKKLDNVIDRLGLNLNEEWQVT